MNVLAEYQNERTFFAQIIGDSDNYVFKTPMIRFFYLKRRSYSFKIAEISVTNRSCDKWIRMKLDQQEKDVDIFTAKMEKNVGYCNVDWITFRVKIINSNETFSFVDTTWATSLWSEKQLADVNVLVGQNKLQAHGVVLSTRSPVFKILLSKISPSGKFTLQIGADEVDFSVVEHFLNYLYTGTLSISANNKQLLALAEMYQVETLKEICQLSVRGHESNSEDITTFLFSFMC